MPNAGAAQQEGRRMNGRGRGLPVRSAPPHLIVPLTLTRATPGYCAGRRVSEL